MSGFKVGDEVFVVQRHRVGVVEKLDQSPVKGLIYWVRFGDDLFFFTEGELGLKADLDKNNQLSTVKDIRDLLLSDEFMAAFAKKFFSTPMPSTIMPKNSAGMICGIDKAKGDSLGVICEWAGKGNEVSE